MSTTANNLRMDYSPSPHHRHQSSLEGIIDFSSRPSLDANRHAEAERKFHRIVNHFEARNPNESNDGRYNRPKLVGLTYEYTRPESKDIFLRAFFHAMALPIDGEDNIDFGNIELEDDLRLALSSFADYLFDNFFLPLRASTQKTPQPSPVFHSIIQQAQGKRVENFIGTPGQISELRGDCLIRDHHRCVITRRFDQDEGTKRIRKNSNSAEDDDGNSLYGTQFDSLEVAHILPRALTKVETGFKLEPSKKIALDILNMFDPGITHLIEGYDIDRPRNAITLTSSFHRFFGAFEVFFEPVPDAAPHTYRVGSFLPGTIVGGLLPVTRTLYLSENRTIDPPSPRLLALHCAIAHILHLSAAAAYIDEVLDDVEKKGIRADGLTELGRLVTLRLNGWLDRGVCA